MRTSARNLVRTRGNAMTEPQFHLRAEKQPDPDPASTVTLEASSVEWLEAAEQDEASVPSFTMQAYSGGALRQWWSVDPIVVDLAGVKLHAGTLAILRDHDSRRAVGHAMPEGVSIGPRAIVATGYISGAGDDAREIIESSRRPEQLRFPWKASIGLRIHRMEKVDAGETVTVNEQTFTGPVRIVRAGSLSEISFVAIGEDASASATVAAQHSTGKHGGPHMNFEAWLKAQGFDPEQLTDEQTTSLKAIWEAQGKTEDEADQDEPPAQPVTAAAQVDLEAVSRDVRQAARTARAEELSRQASIEQLCGAAHRDIAARAIAEDWDETRTELEVLRASRPQASMVNTNHSDVAPARIVEASLCLQSCAGLALSGQITPGAGADDGELERIARAQDSIRAMLLRGFDEATLEAADKQYRGGIALQELLLEAARANGFTGRRIGGNLREVLHYAMPVDPIGIRADFSTFSLPGILSNVANKNLLAGFLTVEQTWRAICRIRSVRDFKRITSYRMIGAFEYEEVGPGGELKHGELGEESFGNQARTYGKMFSITRTDIINDDLGALIATPQHIGRGGGLKFNDVFWTDFMDNDAFFTAERSNYLTGADTALGIDGLTQAETVFLNQTDPNGNPANVEPAILLTPNALATDARNLMQSSQLRDPSATKKTPTNNPHAGKWSTLRSSYLSNPKYAGHSTKAWYMLANPNVVPVIEVCFLNGKQEPTVETAAADFNVLGIQMRGFHDFGMEKQEHRGGVKSKGEA
jgi:hypothetical protein